MSTNKINHINNNASFGYGKPDPTIHPINDLEDYSNRIVYTAETFLNCLLHAMCEWKIRIITDIDIYFIFKHVNLYLKANDVPEIDNTLICTNTGVDSVGDGDDNRLEYLYMNTDAIYYKYLFKNYIGDVIPINSYTSMIRDAINDCILLMKRDDWRILDE